MSARTSKTKSSKHTKASDALKEIEAIPALKTKYNLALRAANDGSNKGVSMYITLGKIGMEISNDPKKVYGDHAVDLVAQALMLHRSTFRRAILIVNHFSEEQLKEFMDRTSAAGFMITVSHLRMILPVPRESDRAKLIDLFYQKSLTYRELGDLIAKMSHSKPDKTPKVRSWIGGVSRLKSMTRNFKERLEGNIDEVLFSHLRKFADGDATGDPEDLTVLKSLRSDIEALKDSVDAAVALIAEATEAVAGKVEEGTVAASVVE